MKKGILILISSMCFQLSAQETSLPAQISIDDAQKIRRHLALNYRIPTAAINDSIKIINYNITFTINEEGRIIDPKIANNENSCTPCEKELLRVIKNAPTVTPAILNDQKVKSLYSLPFKIAFD